MVKPDENTSGYRPYLPLIETERAIKRIKDSFQAGLAQALNLTRVSAPIIVFSRTGLNDNLSGVERPVQFTLRGSEDTVEVVQSLAKWKRQALADYGLSHGEGIYTDMNALRPDEALDNLHSVYVDQWDWERIMHRDERTLDFLQEIVRKIYRVIRETERLVCDEYPPLPGAHLPDEIHFVHSEDLEARYPELSSREREDAICKEYGAVFLIGIGADLRSGRPHDQRAPDYDDWSVETVDGKRGLNGDILVWYPVLGRALELSSMGIRVDEQSLMRQLELQGRLHRAELPFHRRLLRGELPLSIGGGIGQSRLCMIYLRKAHIGEVQVSIWPPEIINACREQGIPLL